MKRELTVGLIAAPDLPAEIANDNLDVLPELFTQQIDENISWNIEMTIDPLSGSAEDVDEILGDVMRIQDEKSWNFAICLTDLPVFYGKYVVAADISHFNKIALISIPAFGWTSFRTAIKDAIILILKDLFHYPEGSNGNDFSYKKRTKPARKLEKEFPIYKVKRVRTMERPEDTDSRYLVVPEINGKFRLLIGMTQSNRPMSIMSSFKKVIAIAFSTGAFGLIFTTMWNLSVILSTGRLIGLMLTAISILILWIIVSHNLWERPSARNEKKLRRLYNMTTLSTLFFSVVTYYSLLYLLFLIAIGVLIPPDVFKEFIKLEKQPGLVEYLRLAWLAASISTIAGAVGAGMENEELVRDITYGYRQKQRYKEIRNQGKPMY